MQPTREATKPKDVECPDCHQRVRVVEVARVHSLNFHTTDATGIGESCPQSYQPVSP